MERQQVVFTKGEGSGKIDDLIDWLNEAKKKGATDYEMEWSQDPVWAFKWLRTYRIKTDEELKQEKIKKLKKELKELEG